MTALNSRQKIHLFLLAVVLAVVLWLGNLVERSVVPERSELSFSPPGGSYDQSQLLEIRPSRPSASIVFATNGAEPGLTVGTLYERPLRLDSESPGVTVVRAREVVDGVPGPVLSASYVMGVKHALPILSVIAEPADLWDPDRGILANIWQRGQEWERLVHTTFVDDERGERFEISAGLRIDASDRSDRPKPSFRLYFRQEYGAPRLAYPLFPRHQQDNQSHKRLLLQAGDRSGHWTLLEEQLWTDVAAELDGYVAQGRFVLLFLNGEPWGIFRLSERVDRFFLEDRFGIQSADIIQNGDVIEGDDQNWDALMNWLGTHDLREPENLAHIHTQIDVDGLTDYAILQAYFARDDWCAARPRNGGGRWFWLFGGGKGKLTRSQNGTLALWEVSDQPDDLVLILSKLLENPDYRAHFVARVADLLNTALAPTAVQVSVDRLAEQLRPDVGYETARWPGPFGEPGLGDSEWERNVVALRDLAQVRPDALRQQMIVEFGLRGTAPLTFSLSANEGGYVVVNGRPVSDSPWSGTFFLDTELDIIAVPEPGYVFAGWEGGKEGASGSHFTLAVDGPRTFTARFTPAPDDALGLRPNDVIINEYWVNDNGTRYSSVGGHPIEGDWFELLVTRPGGVDLRSWRVTDNNSKTATSEGSIILPAIEAFATVPRGTAILIITTESNSNEARFHWDDVDPSDGQMVLYVGNGHLDVTTDPGFGIGRGDDNLVLLAPGSGPGFADDVGIDFVAEGNAVTPLSFGVLVDGVTFESAFEGLGDDDGALFTGKHNNDDGAVGWIVDPAPEQSGDDVRAGTTNIVTPGALNYGQYGLSVPTHIVWVLMVGSLGAAIALHLFTRRRRSA